ncbi:LOW QUALITY PROTEIN: transposase, partial [Micromonospora sp. ATCC 39149]
PTRASGSSCGPRRRGTPRSARRAGPRQGGSTAITDARWLTCRSTGGGGGPRAGTASGVPHARLPPHLPGTGSRELERYQRRTARLNRQVKAVVKELAGRAGARLPAIPAMGLSRHTALRTLLRIPLPTGRTPHVIGADDFALRRRHRYATVVIDAETHERIDVLPDRTANTLQAWLREHPGVEVVCRDGSATYAEAIRRALPHAVQVADRWHLWHNLWEATLSEVKAHSTCWAPVLDAPIYDGPRAQTTLQRWHQVHDLLD